MLHIDTGLYTYLIQGAPRGLVDSLNKLYPDAISLSKNIADYQIDIRQTSFLRTLLRPQVALSIDGHQPFNPIPPKNLLPSIEWAMNWCIAAYDHTHLLIHCSVIEKNGKVILFPARSGSGKSTTSSYMVLNGWHLFFDEMAVIDLKTGLVKPVYRPSSLKNESINIVKNLNTGAYISESTANTHKGEIAHLMPHSYSDYATFRPSKVSAVVLLNYNPDSNLEIQEVDQSISFSKLVHNAFNYSVIGHDAFKCLTSLVSNTRNFELSFSNLSDVAEFLEEIVDDT